MGISFCSHPNSNDAIATDLSTWHDRCAGVAWYERKCATCVTISWPGMDFPSNLNCDIKGVSDMDPFATVYEHSIAGWLLIENLAAIIFITDTLVAESYKKWSASSKQISLLLQGDFLEMQVSFILIRIMDRHLPFKWPFLFLNGRQNKHWRHFAKIFVRLLSEKM